MKTQKEARKALLSALDMLEVYSHMAKIEHANVELGILGKRKDGSGTVMASFEFNSFFEDFKAILVPANLSPWTRAKPNTFTRCNEYGDIIATVYPTEEDWSIDVTNLRENFKDCADDAATALARADELLLKLGFILQS